MSDTEPREEFIRRAVGMNVGTIGDRLREAYDAGFAAHVAVKDRQIAELTAKLARIERAWNDVGIMPEHHKREQQKLWRNWPMLANAIDPLTTTGQEQAPVEPLSDSEMGEFIVGLADHLFPKEQSNG